MIMHLKGNLRLNHFSSERNGLVEDCVENVAAEVLDLRHFICKLAMQEERQPPRPGVPHSLTCLHACHPAVRSPERSPQAPHDRA